MNNENFYLTDNLSVKDNNLFFEKDENSKKVKIKINKKNWHNYLSEYGWEKLENHWRKKIRFGYNYPLGFLDCGAGGDCLFAVIAEAFNLEDIYKNGNGNIYSIESVRKVASEQINKSNFDEIISIYRALYENNDFDGDWNPTEINSVDEFRKVISTSGDKYWGDHICLNLIQNALNINFIVMKTDFSIENYDNSGYFYPIGQDLDKNGKYIIIYYTDEIHFQLVGYFNGNVMKTIFLYEELPEKLIELYKMDMNKS